MRLRSWWLAVLIAVGFVGTSWAATDDAPALSVKTKRVVVFKDGYCMFLKEATGETDEAARVYMDDIPGAMVLGTFWAVPEKGRLVSTIARQIILPKAGKSETEKSLVFEFEPEMAGKKVKMDVSYFGPGIRWIPTYRIALKPDGKADLVMQAEILNEAEDLTKVALDLVVGVPNFRFKEVVSPLALLASLVNPLTAVAPQLMGQFTNTAASNLLFAQRAGEVRQPPAQATPGAAVPALPPALAAEGAQDLFAYEVPRLSMRAGERAMIGLVSADVPLRHIYTWDIRLNRSNVESLPTGGKKSSPIKILENEVWHQVELTNKTNVPWTTGAALLVQGHLPLAQELLTYTPVGGVCQVPITVAVDVRGTYAEEETGREPKAIRHNNTDWTNIAKKGTLKVTNYKKEAVAMVITCQFGGNATRASDDVQVVVNDHQSADWTNVAGHPALNGHSVITWSIDVKAGETRDLTCEYNYYVP
jgi:hypothetical protein